MSAAEQFRRQKKRLDVLFFVFDAVNLLKRRFNSHL